MGAPGAGVRFAAQPRRALRQGRVDPRARLTATHRLKYADEARRTASTSASRWDQAINEISDKLLAIRKESGPDAVFWVGSLQAQQRAVVPAAQVRVVLRHATTCDHQARICHSTTVAGVANTWGYGAMTNSYNDMQNTKCALYIGSQRRRGAPGVDAAHAARQGDRREDDRRRSALHAHRGQGRRVRAHPLGHRHRVPVRHAVPHLQERLGGQEVHPRPRLRHGQGQART